MRGQRAARQRRSGTSALPRAGRYVSSSRRARFTRSRIRWPPSHVNRSSYCKRPRTPSHTARPLLNCSCVAATHCSSAAVQVDAIGPAGVAASSPSLAPQAASTSRGTYNRPARSRGRSPARSSSAAARCTSRPTIDRAPRRGNRRCGAPAGRRDWRSAGSNRTPPPTKRSGSSWYPDRTRSADRRTMRAADRATGFECASATTIRSS